MRPSLLGATSFGFHWAVSPWLAVPAIGLAGWLIYWLYKMQRRIASRRVVRGLTAIRLLLVLLVGILFASPVYSWRRTFQTPGTLYVLFDASGSMDIVDRQASNTEQLQWAELLNVQPAGPRLRFNRLSASLGVLSDQIALAQQRLPGDADAAGADWMKLKAQWIRTAGRIAQTLSEADPASPAQKQAALDALKAFSASLDAAVPGDSEPARRSLMAAVAAIDALGDQADASYLAAHSSETPLREALQRVGGLSRLGLLKAALAQQAPGTVGEILRGGSVRFVSFADAPSLLAGVDAKAAAATLAAGGHATNLGAALQWVNQQLRPDERAAVIIFSDGRQTSGPDPAAAARLLAAQGVNVFSIGVGSRRPVADATIEQVDAPQWINKDDTLRGQATLRLDGLAGTPLNVVLERDGVQVSNQSITPASEHDARTIQFEDKPPAPGLLAYQLRIAPAAGEAITQNNAHPFRLSVRQEKLNVLLVDDQPRWEYRYLASVLERDRRVKLQQVLLQPASVEQVQRPPPVAASVRNASAAADMLPASQADWAGFDLIILGDLPPESLDAQQQRWLAQAVYERGAALALIAGPFNMPQRYLNVRPLEADASASRLADLLPVFADVMWDGAELATRQREGFAFDVTPAGRQQAFADLAAGLPATLPKFFWHSLQTRAKAGANVLWSIGSSAAATQPNDDSQRLQRALVCTSSIGAGKVLYLATDQTWRLRQVSGVDLHERFWGQVVGWAAGDDLPAGGEFARFGTDRPTYSRGQSVVASARLRDPATRLPLAGQGDLKIVARQAGKIVAQAPLREEPGAPGNYRGDIASLPPGASDLSLEGAVVPTLLEKSAPPLRPTLGVQMLADVDVEQQNVNVDFEALGQIARAGGGLFVSLTNADLLADKVPRLDQQIEEVTQVGLFLDPRQRLSRVSHAIFLAAFAILAATEWIIRKQAGLV